ncbi:hypothetical protein EPO34_02250 [Patescibacteria group bacterium]|nr:MAG: hypothetical protein EPO34_02250 [Patescibacteria group bacterium]
MLACSIDAEYGFCRYDDGTLALVLDVRLPRGTDEAEAYVWLASMRLVVRARDKRVLLDAGQLPGLILHGRSGDDIEFTLAFGPLPSDVMGCPGARMSIETTAQRGGILYGSPIPPLPPSHA